MQGVIGFEPRIFTVMSAVSTDSRLEFPEGRALIVYAYFFLIKHGYFAHNDQYGLKDHSGPFTIF